MTLDELLGPENARRLSEVAGGTRLCIPKHIGKPPRGGRTPTKLEILVGPELAALLVFHFGDSCIYVPMNGAARPVDRRKAAALIRKGLSAPAIALKLGCSTRTIEKHRARLLVQKPGKRKGSRP